MFGFLSSVPVLNAENVEGVGVANGLLERGVG